MLELLHALAEQDVIGEAGVLQEDAFELTEAHLDGGGFSDFELLAD